MDVGVVEDDEHGSEEIRPELPCNFSSPEFHIPGVEYSTL